MRHNIPSLPKPSWLAARYQEALGKLPSPLPSTVRLGYRRTPEGADETAVLPGTSTEGWTPENTVPVDVKPTTGRIIGLWQAIRDLLSREATRQGLTYTVRGRR